jgi:hypothetical protein
VSGAERAVQRLTDRNLYVTPLDENGQIAGPTQKVENVEMHGHRLEHAWIDETIGFEHDIPAPSVSWEFGELPTMGGELVQAIVHRAAAAEAAYLDTLLKIAIARGHGVAVIQSSFHTDYAMLPRHTVVEVLRFPGWYSFDAWRARQGWSDS